jgi:branched-chain amino acid transport system substrate-binding protein
MVIIKKFICLLSTAFTTGLLFMLMASTVIAAEPIKIGAVLPLAETAGKDASRSMQLAVKQINAAGGLLGRQLELIIVDDEMRPGKAVAAIEKLVNTDKVDIIVGGIDNATTLEVIPVLKKHTKVTVWMGASSKKIEDAVEGQDWFFHLQAWDYQLGAYYEKMWREVVQKYPNVKRKIIFVAYKEDPFGSDSFSIASPIAKAYLNLLKGEVYNSPDYRTILSKAREFGPDIFIWDGSEKDAISMLEEAKNSGFAPPVYLGTTLVWPADFGKQVGADGIMFYSYWHDSMKSRNRASSEYSAAFNNEFKEAPVTYFGPLAYTNIMIVANAVKKAGSLDKDALINALAATNYESPLGDTFFFARSLGIKYQAGANPKLMQWQSGSVKIIWPWELATGKLIYPFPAQGFNKAAPLEEEKKPTVPAPKPPAKGSKPAAPAKMKRPIPAVKPTTSAPAAKPATTTTTTTSPAAKPAATTSTPVAKPATTTTTTITTTTSPAATAPAPAKGDKAAVAAVIPAAEKDKVDMTGTWNLTVITPRGPGSPDFVLKQEGNKLTGEYQGTFGQAPVTGAVQGKNFEMKYKLGGRTDVYKGKVDGNQMSGNIDFGGVETGTFSGKKK